MDQQNSAVLIGRTCEQLAAFQPPFAAERIDESEFVNLKSF